MFSKLVADSNGSWEDDYQALQPYLADEQPAEHPTKPEPSRLEVEDKRQQFWKDVWIAVASLINIEKPEDATKWANKALEAYDQLIKQSKL